MQSEEADFKIESIGLISNYEVTLVVVAGAILILVIIFVYVHFDAAITKFIEDAKKYKVSKIKKFKRMLRRKFSKADTKIRDKARILNKIRMLGALQLAAKRQAEAEEKKEASGQTISIISTNDQTMQKCESTSTIATDDFNPSDLD